MGAAFAPVPTHSWGCMVARQNSRGQHGSAAVELALVLPILLAIVMAIVEFGYLFFLQGSVTGAAREGARSYAIFKNQTTATAAVNAASPNSSLTAVAYKDSTTLAAVSTCDPGESVTVVVTYTYSSLTGWLNFALGSPTVLTGKGTMRCGG